MLTEDHNAPPVLHFSQGNIENMHETGLFSFFLYGHVFYLEVFPTAFSANGMRYLREEANKVLINVRGNDKSESSRVYTRWIFLNKVQSLANENDVHIVSRTIDINTDQFYQ